VFEYFPGNYVWNLAVVAALNSGGLIDEVDRACRPIREAAARGEDAGTTDFLAAWTDLTDQLAQQAETALRAGHGRTAGELYFRATNYLCNAERMQRASSAGRLQVYQRVLDLAQRAMEHRDPLVSRVSVPYEDTTLPAYFSQAPAAAGGPAPVMILWNGLDSTKEHMYTSSHWAELAARGISCLMIDCPGSGEALRLQGLTARVDTEAWATACVDYLQARSDVDPARIGLAGWSLGGYYAPRAAAFEPRLTAVAGISGPYDFAANWDGLPSLTRETIQHHTGASSPEEARERAAQLSLAGVAERIAQPCLVITGRNDRLIPWEDTKRIADEAQNATWVLFDDGNHVCNNIPYKYRPLVGDWMRAQLS
jgi:dienelactone hydrolase